MGQFDRHRYQKPPVRFHLRSASGVPDVRLRLNLEAIGVAPFRPKPPFARCAARCVSIDPTSAQATLKEQDIAENRVDRLVYQGRTPSP
jgi:hypothetical protein